MTGADRVGDSLAPAWAAHLPLGGSSADVHLDADETLIHAWVRQWRRAPRRQALHDATVGWVEAGQLDRDSAAVARHLAALGAAPGDRILCSAANSYRLVVAHVAALRRGLVVVPANTAYRRREVQHLVRDAGAQLAVVDDPERASWITEAAPSAVVIEPPQPVAEPGDVDVDLDRARPDDPALLCYTSGTTGEPKGAVLSHRNLLASSAAVALAWRWSRSDRLVLCLPLFHAHGLAVGLHGTLLAGGSAVLLPSFDVDGVLDAIRQHDATLFFGVPTMYTRLASSARGGELAALRLCVSGSAPLDATTWREIERRSGQRVLERYGMTETLMNVSNPYEGERRPGTVGLPLPNVELRLADVGDDSAGEIQVRGPNVFDGYWNRPEATADSFTADGWFRTGDIGTVAADGYVTIVGRVKELIITGGYNVYPREVEDVLRRAPGVHDIAVAGTPSPEWGEAVTAFVVAPTWSPADAAALERLAHDELARYKRPRAVHLVDAIPRNALGKVLRADLVHDVGSSTPSR